MPAIGRAQNWANRCVILMRFWEFRNQPRWPRSKRSFASSPRNFIQIKARIPRRRRDLSRRAPPIEIIGDEKKRAAFDRGEIDADGKPRFGGFEGFGTEGAVFGRRSHAGGGPGFRHFEFNFSAASIPAPRD